MKYMLMFISDDANWDPSKPEIQVFQATRAAILRELGRPDEARDAERALLMDRIGP